MPKNKIKWTFLTVLFFLAFVAIGQTLPDFSTINISELSDSQVESLIQRIEAAGYSQEELIQLASAQGLSASDIAKLNTRIAAFKSKRLANLSLSPVDDSRLRKPYIDSLAKTTSIDSDVFGLDVFRKSSFLTFQNNLNIPTPEDYQLGPGDQVFIDIYGQSESYYEAEVNPDGNILLENIGPVSISGLTVSQAKQRVRERMSKTYKGLAGADPDTYLSFSLGQLRTIKVSIVGSVQIPGTYNMSSMSTVFNALYTAGGIRENGTLREIKVFRKSKLVTVVDVYDFIINGNSQKNILLKNDDVIIIGPYTNRVTLKGAVKTPGRFELNGSESLKTLLSYSGGFSENAFQNSIKVTRIVGGERVVADVRQDQYEIFVPMPGDIFEISEVLDRYVNRVIVKGAVFRPGNFAITSESTVKSLVDQIDGLRPDAFTNRAFIIRTNEDFSTETLSFDLGKIISGESADIKLQKEDVLNILSKNDLESERYVEVSGEVNSPGVYAFSQGMTLQDLILIAGGFNESATGKGIEITRRVTDESERNYDLSEIIVKDEDLDFLNANVSAPTLLSPFDHVVVRRNPNFHIQRFASVEGQVLYPGQYAIKNEGERISDILNRAGGLDDYAFVEGATLIRKTEFFENGSDVEKRIDDLLELQERVQSEPGTLTESQVLLLERIEENLARLEAQSESNQTLSSFAKRERLKEILERNSLLGDKAFKQAEAIGIKLNEILSNPGSSSDLLVQEGDVLIIPKKTEMVRLRGKLLYPTTVRYEEGRSLKYYINSAGGFDTRAKKNGTYVVYANGEVARTKRFLWFKFYPKAARGAEIIVPTKPLKIPVRIQDVVAITSGIATLALVINQISNNNNNN